MAIQRIALTQPIESRTNSLRKDSYSSNCVFETRDKKRELIKRPGLVKATQIVAVSPPSVLLSQGLVGFNNKVVSVIANTVYQTDPSTYITTTVGSMSVSTGSSYFTKTLQDAYLIFHNKATAYSLSSGGAFATISGAPSGPYVGGIVFLDNYVFIATSSNNRIYNSNVGDPLTWNALNYISFEQTNDSLVAIVKHLNYLVAFGSSSTQFFYDAANASGSPLALSASYTSEIGCATADSVIATSNTVLWIGTSKVHGKAVYLMDGVSPVRVSTNSIEKHIEGDSLSKVSSYCYKFNGHTLYILTLHNSNITLVYDIDQKMWYVWTQYALASSDQPYPNTWYESYFRPSYYAEVNSVPYVLDDDTANLYYFDQNTYTDDGQNIYVRTVTDISDNGTTKRKFYGRLEIVGDKVAGVMQVRHSGDDYTTWSSYRSIDLSASRSAIYLGGADRRRAWEFLCKSNVPLRIDAAEIEYRIGEMDQEQGQGASGGYRT